MVVGRSKYEKRNKIEIWKIKYGEYYNEVSRKDYFTIRFFQIKLLVRKIVRWIKSILKEWFNLTFIISVIAVLVYFLLAYYIGNYYKGYGLRRILWDNKNILFTFLVAPNLIKFTLNTSRVKSNNARRHDMYSDMYISFDNIVGQYFKDKLELDYSDGCLYTKDGLEEIRRKINIVTVCTDDFIYLCKNLEEELPIVKISKNIDFYFTDNREIISIRTIADNFQRRYKNIKTRTEDSRVVLIDTLWEIIENYFDFILIFGANEKYRRDTDIQKNIVKICMRNENNHEWLKRQYELASMSGIGYEIPNSDYQY